MSADEAPVRAHVEGGVLTLTLNRPARRNALSPELVAALTSRLEAARTDDSVRALVLTGAGDKAFCAGGDLGAGMTGGGGLPGKRDEKGAFVTLVQTLRGLGKPVVARLNGDALGGGVGVMLACDLVVAADDVHVGLPEVKVGLWPMMVTALLVRHVGHKVAAEMMLLGEKHDAATALRWGLVNRVVPRAELDATVAEMADALASRSPAVLRMGLEAFHQTDGLPLDAALWNLRDRLLINTFLEDAGEGVMAFLEKRPPRWKGR